MFGVPYGTSYWQVGNSSEQNGTSYKTSMTKAKQNLLDSQIQYMFGHLQLVPTDIIPLVNLCWDDSFANVRTNKKAIVERGWAPFNRNLLLYTEITI